MEESIAEEIWKGKIPIEFSLFPNEIASVKLPQNQFGFYSRLSYLPAISQSIVEYFRLYAIELLSEVWFESKGMPLKVNLPIGVLYDMSHGIDARKDTPRGPIAPWKITVRFQSFPVDGVMKCATEQASSRLFAHSLKQALFLLFGSTRPYNNLPIESQDSLWLAAKFGQLARFNPLAEILMPSIDSIRIIPVRIVSTFFPITLQRPFQSFQADGSPTMLVSIAHIVRDYLQLQKPVLDSDTVASSSANAMTSITPINVDSTVVTSAVSSDIDNHFAIVIHGITLPLDAKLFDIWSIFCHADLFLYISVVALS